MALSKKSEYFGSLSAEAKQRYENKLTVAGLSMDPTPWENANGPGNLKIFHSCHWQM